MHITAILTFGFAAISTVFAAPTAQYEEAPVTAPQDPPQWNLHVNSVKGQLFKHRPIVALPDGTVDGTPQNHVPLPRVHLPASFGLENFTIHPPSEPVAFLWTTLETPDGPRLQLLNTNQAETWRNWEWVSQFIVPAPDDLIAMGWATVLGDHDCPTELPGLTCSLVDWEIDAETRVFKAKGEGAWDALKTKEGLGWRVVWKKDVATVQHEVQLVVVEAGEEEGY